MAIVDEVQELANRATRQFDAMHDFVEHTKAVWDTFRAWVGGGNTLTVTNPVTGTTVAEGELSRLGQPYLSQHTVVFAFGRFVSIFEEFLFDLLRILLLRHPARLSSKTVDVGTILAAPDRDSIVLGVVEKELNEVKYRKVREWFTYLEAVIKLGCPSADEIEGIAEVKASRDVLEHNAGVVNAIYLTKSGSKARFQVGDWIGLPDAYFRETWQLLRKVVAEVSAAVIQRFTTSP